ncbi:hypothetical protein TRAPUB_8888 [Trametes pubescens]|uniref:Uncharacterized protein n=1 Tax=Trametes pubescens TaxID=154538 RepID=A0A1M2W3X2_TRAPU|nr:hypothetical protein TRAPUB_8888 [Trametes pubescens]
MDSQPEYQEGTPTPPPPPLTQPRRVYEMGMRTAPPADKRRGMASTRDDASNGGDDDSNVEAGWDVFGLRQAQSEGKPRKVGELRTFTIAGKDLQNLGEGGITDSPQGTDNSTPTPRERRRQPPQPEDEREPVGGGGDNEDDPFGVRSNSMCMDQAYGLNEMDWDDIMGRSSPPRVQEAESLGDRTIGELQPQLLPPPLPTANVSQDPKKRGTKRQRTASPEQEMRVDKGKGRSEPNDANDKGQPGREQGPSKNTAEMTIQLQIEPQQPQMPPPPPYLPRRKLVQNPIALSINQARSRLHALTIELAEETGISLESALKVLMESQRTATPQYARQDVHEMTENGGSNSGAQTEARGLPRAQNPALAPSLSRSRSPGTGEGLVLTPGHEPRAGEGTVQKTKDPRVRPKPSDAGPLPERSERSAAPQCEEAEAEMEVDPDLSTSSPIEELYRTAVNDVDVGRMPGHMPMAALVAASRLTQSRKPQSPTMTAVALGRTKEQYRQALESLGLVKMPDGRWPVIHTRSAYDRLRTPDNEAYEEWKREPRECCLVLEVARHGDLDDGTTARIVSKLEHILEIVVGHGEFTLAAPPEPVKEKEVGTMNAPGAFLLSRIPPLAALVLREQFAVCTKEIAFWAYRDDKEIPTYLGAVTGLMQSGGGSAEKSIIKHFKKEAIFMSIQRLLEENPAHKPLARQTTFRIVEAIAVRLVRQNKHDSGSPLIAHIYMAQPTSNGAKWDEWHKSLLNIPFDKVAGRAVAFRKMVRCYECHGVDHEDDECPYRNIEECPYRNIEEWAKRTSAIEKHLNEKRATARANAVAEARASSVARPHGGQGAHAGGMRRTQADNKRWAKGEGPPFPNAFQGQNWQQPGGNWGNGGHGHQGTGSGQASRPPRR